MIDFIVDNWGYVSVLFCAVAAIVAGLAGAAIKIRQESFEATRFDHIQAEVERAELLAVAEQQVKQRRRVRALS